jgi:hypothetical protein
VRELVLGSHRFNEIERGLPGISRSLLASRLRELEGVVERLPSAQSSAYHLSEAGTDLKTVIEALGAWASGGRRAEAGGVGRGVVDLENLPSGSIALLPDRRTVVEFDFTDPRGRRVWLLQFYYRDAA